MGGSDMAQLMIDWLIVTVDSYRTGGSEGGF
jgi:hypothetical protein